MPISPRIFTIAAVALLAGAAAPAAGAAPTGIYAQQAELAAADGATNDSFGSSVAVSGDTLVVGAPVKHGADDSAGAAYVYERPASGSWADAKQVAKLTLSGGRASGTLGHVAISGDTIVAGVGDQRVGTHEQQGAVFVFVRPTGGWADAHETAVLTASDGATSDVLGSGVALSGDTVVAGAEGKKVGDKERQGAAYVFVKPATGWKNGVQTAELAASSGATGDGAGNAVAI
ncbi:MAG: hypothetical protein QOD37_1359, partial [Gaiellales bacterium]|nr:hypothetical protein [Gaiellales bacterium]